MHFFFDAEMDDLSHYKMLRVQLAQMFPGMKPSDFDTAGDAPQFPYPEIIRIRDFEIRDMIAVVNATANYRKHNQQKRKTR